MYQISWAVGIGLSPQYLLQTVPIRSFLMVLLKRITWMALGVLMIRNYEKLLFLGTTTGRIKWLSQKMERP